MVVANMALAACGTPASAPVTTSAPTEAPTQAPTAAPTLTPEELGKQALCDWEYDSTITYDTGTVEIAKILTIFVTTSRGEELCGNAIDTDKLFSIHNAKEEAQLVIDLVATCSETKGGVTRYVIAANGVMIDCDGFVVEDRMQDGILHIDDTTGWIPARAPIVGKQYLFASQLTQTSILTDPDGEYLTTAENGQYFVYEGDNSFQMVSDKSFTFKSYLFQPFVSLSSLTNKDCVSGPIQQGTFLFRATPLSPVQDKIPYWSVQEPSNSSGTVILGYVNTPIEGKVLEIYFEYTQIELDSDSRNTIWIDNITASCMP